MKKFIWLAVLLVVLVPTAVLAGCGNKVPAGAIATVGSGVVTKVQFDQTMKQAKAQLASQSGGFPKAGTAQYNQITASIVNYLVQNEIIRQQAAKSNVSVTAKEVQAQIKAITQKVGGQAKLNTLMKQQGLDSNVLTDIETAQMLQTAMQKKITGGVKVTDAQISAYYKDPANKSQFVTAATVTARHVLVKTKALALKVEALLKANNTNANWAKVAKKYSIDTGTKSIGGSLGTFPKGRMVKPFDNAAFSLKVGVVSAPVKSQFGWHVIEVTKKTPGSSKTFAQAKTLIQSQLLYTAQSNAWSTWLKGVEKNLSITYLPGYNPDTLTASPSPSASASPAS